MSSVLGMDPGLGEALLSCFFIIILFVVLFLVRQTRELDFKPEPADMIEDLLKVRNTLSDRDFDFVRDLAEMLDYDMTLNSAQRALLTDLYRRTFP